MSTHGFCAGTLVHTEQGLIPIQEIKVGDMVLSKPESNEGEIGYTPVVSTFQHNKQPLWLLQADKFYGRDINNKIVKIVQLDKYENDTYNLLVTPNHPIWVVGIGILDEYNNVSNQYEPYSQPHWKRIDQLQQYEMIVNNDGILFSIARVQPLYQFKEANNKEALANIAWYQQNYHITSDMEDYDNYNFNWGWAINVLKYQDADSAKGMRLIGKPWDDNSSFDPENGGAPYTATVYNFETERYYTYFVQRSGIWVHQ
ncbi:MULTISPECIES: hypothetical protein [Acinetobacter]|uniref:Hint domain-containing protein n=1 Tax=Acinetobacter corruptisaponis TaxID=3045147 RepID=A0ABY8S8I9_9GAMM|nr:hypothetical protein [Acinetobacter sp. KCTC 92772]WHP07137.1 hypothetical protein QLH32_06685 [Acinetobacter sp. KCTC 92772]